MDEKKAHKIMYELAHSMYDHMLKGDVPKFKGLNKFFDQNHKKFKSADEEMFLEIDTLRQSCFGALGLVPMFQGMEKKCKRDATSRMRNIKNKYR